MFPAVLCSWLRYAGILDAGVPGVSPKKLLDKLSVFSYIKYTPSDKKTRVDYLEDGEGLFILILTQLQTSA